MVIRNFTLNHYASHSMHRLRPWLVIFLLGLFTSPLLAQQQKVGVVLSGGGASAMAHIGFLRAMEENNIPIDFISGSSMGAVIGAMYCSGFTIEEIDSLARTEEFYRMATGDLDKELEFFFKKEQPDASMATIKYSKGSIITQSIPANRIDPALLDFNLMQLFSMPSAACGGDFDSLFIPFRCIASDIESKESVIFKEGNLAQAVRASSTYPFYIPPIEVDGKLLFDGGLYNNFPSDVLYEEFLLDVIIGCNVSENEEPPKSDDVLSQIKNMITYKTNFESVCEAMVIVEPESSISTFDFGSIDESVGIGYQATIERIPEIMSFVSREVSKEEVNMKRAHFRQKFKPIVFDEIRIEGLNKAQKTYVRKLLRKKSIISINDLKSEYFRVYADDKIRAMYPLAEYKASTGKYRLDLIVEPEKDILLSFGGNFSSRPINTGFIGFRYNLFGKTSSTFTANSYFGKFYGSVHADAKVDLPSRIPLSIQPGFTLNRWDYFKSQATFFEDVKPSFNVQNERFGGLRFQVPVGNKAKLSADADIAELSYEYYQDQDFLSTDTADQTVFTGGVAGGVFEWNSLNRKQFANKGSRLEAKFKFISGEEETVPGSTAVVRDTTMKDHSWVTAKVQYKKYFFQRRKYHLGAYLEGLASTQPFYDNYQATIIAAPAFEPMPESQTFLMPQFRAHNYGAAGIMNVLSLAKNLDFRAEGYVFYPLEVIAEDADRNAVYKSIVDPKFMAAGMFVFHTPIGPVNLAATYYDGEDIPWVFSFNFGYIIFNRSMRN